MSSGEVGVQPAVRSLVSPGSSLRSGDPHIAGRAQQHPRYCQRAEMLRSTGMMKAFILFLGVGMALGSLYTDPDSCRGRCEEPYSHEDECHCDADCRSRNSCCWDYLEHCGEGEEAVHRRAEEHFSSSHDAISDEELLHVSEQLYGADRNKAQPKDIAINPQHQVDPDQTGLQEDRSPEPLYAYVNEKLFSKPTYASFIRLLDNYQRATGREEEVTAEELQEQNVFLREVMKTELMKKLFAFLHQKNRYSSEEEFLQDLKEMWFGLYSRGDGEKDSSGFEHVFSGEIKKGKVSGFHNWIRFYLLEKQGLVNYFSHNFDGPWDTYPDVLGLQFSWDGFYKEVGSAFIGCSPEFEFGIYTLCFIARPGRACHLSLGGHGVSIQTYTWTKSTYGHGKKYIATAYVISP
ncbi:poly(U)-specific endoribonuclease-like isoform X2 [Lagopus leucura]|uniref:poly(U)-specific endoribonuclease-like isoform X2 n=1 Tax=Lagopus leucura TaxID=30410 RepID=UPI001C670A01|nr:poly(U)-specific endoribonuclease-like isoform X2 [Lagopus leucura]